jgi:hypothetical protein
VLASKGQNNIRISEKAFPKLIKVELKELMEKRIN